MRTIVIAEERAVAGVADQDGVEMFETSEQPMSWMEMVWCLLKGVLCLFICWAVVIVMQAFPSLDK